MIEPLRQLGEGDGRVHVRTTSKRLEQSVQPNLHQQLLDAHEQRACSTRLLRAARIRLPRLMDHLAKLVKHLERSGMAGGILRPRHAPTSQPRLALSTAIDELRAQRVRDEHLG